MNYNLARPHILDGDIALVEGKKFFSWLIRRNLGQQFSHVALFLWQSDGLWLAEMVEGKGFQMVPASQWLQQQSGPIFWGDAPDSIVRDKIAPFVASYRADPANLKYGYWTLLKVFWSQLTGRPLKAQQQVCSTFIQSAWSAAGYQCDELESPGGLIEHVECLTPITVG